MKLSWQNVEVRFIRGGGGLWAPQYRLDEDWFRTNLVDYDLWYIWHGRGFLRDAKGDVHRLEEGMCLLMRPHSVMEVWQRPDSRLGTRYFHFDLLDSRGRRISPRRLKELPLACHVPDPAYYDALTRRMANLPHIERLTSDEHVVADAGHVMTALVKALLLEFILTARLKEVHWPSDIDQDHFMLASRTLAVIRENPAEADISQIAEQAGYTIDHFRRLFKRATGKTPHQALVSARIDYGRQLLTDTRLSIGEIAEQLGYSSVQHFSLQFKQRIGTPPSEYRASRWPGG